MNKGIKNTFEFIGILATLWGLVTTIQDEKFIYAVTLGIVLIVIGFFRFKDHIIKPIEFHGVNYEFILCDNLGQKAIGKKDKIFTINSDNFTTLHDKNIGGTGNVVFKKTNIGATMIIVEGGAYSLVTIFNPPLKKNIEYRHSIEMEYTNCFTQDKESILLQADRICSNIQITVIFPDDRRCKNAKAYIIYGDTANELEAPKILDNSKKLEFIVKKPKQFSKYNIEFEW